MELTHIQLKKIIKEELSFFTNQNFTNQNKNQSSKYEVASLMLETVSNIKPSQKKVKEALKRERFNSLVRRATPVYNEYIDTMFESFEKELDSKNSLEQLVEHKIDFCLKEQKIKERCSLIEKALFALYGVKENLSEQPEGEEEKPKGFFGKMKAKVTGGFKKLKAGFKILWDAVKLIGVLFKGMSIVIKGGEFSEKDQALWKKASDGAESLMKSVGAWIGVKIDTANSGWEETKAKASKKAEEIRQSKSGMWTRMGKKLANYWNKKIAGPVEKFIKKSKEVLSKIKIKAISSAIKLVCIPLVFLGYIVAIFDPTGIAGDIVNGLGEAIALADKIAADIVAGEPSQKEKQPSTA